MARKPRVEHEDALYHVINRGNNRENIFGQTQDKICLISLLEKAVKIDGAEIFAYVVMINHYHIALRTTMEPLSKIMHRINLHYSRYYNDKYGRTGHVFEGRYKAIPIQNDNYLMAVIRYIHNNPVRAGLCSRVEDYTWSSDIYYRRQSKEFINTNLFLGALSNNYENSLSEYDAFMKQEDSMNSSNMDCRLENAIDEKSIVGTRNIIHKPLHEILSDTGIDSQGQDEIVQGNRKRELIPYKIWYAREALKAGYSMKEIGRFINVSDTAIRKYLKISSVPGTKLNNK